MGKSFHLVESLEPPLAVVNDRVMFVPRGKELVIERPEPRLLLICDGRVQLDVDGRMLGEIGSGDIVVVPGPARMVYRSQNRAISRLHLFIVFFDLSQFTYDPKTGWLLQLSDQHEETDFTVFIQNRFCTLRHLVKVQTPFMHLLLKAIREDADGESPGFRHRVSARTRLLVTLVGGLFPSRDLSGARPPAEQPRSLWIIEQVKEYLLTHAGDSLALEDVARHLRLSAEHIARVFKREESMTVFDYLRDLRVERAKTLLASSSLAVHDIAREAGYSSATLFCRNFKQATGMTPTHYRQKGGGRHSFSGSTMGLSKGSDCGR